MWKPPTTHFDATPVTSVYSDEAKNAFGKALNTHKTAFEAACTVWANTQQALWASQFLIADPIVLAAKDADNSTEKLNLLDKDQLAARILEYAEETDASGRFRTTDHKDRYNYLKLYAEIRGYVGKIDINPTINNTNNTMKIVFVKPDNQNSNKETKVIEQEQTPNQLPLKLKLVGGAAS